MSIRKTGAADGRILADSDEELTAPETITATAAAAWAEPDEEGLTAENRAADE